jgi:hypothetical protein
MVNKPDMVSCVETATSSFRGLLYGEETGLGISGNGTDAGGGRVVQVVVLGGEGKGRMCVEIEKEELVDVLKKVLDEGGGWEVSVRKL